MQNKMIRAALVGLFVAASAIAAAQGRVNGVSVTKLTTGVEVMIQGSELKEPKAAFGDTDKIYVLEFDAPFSGKQETMSVWQHGLEAVRATKLGTHAQKTKFVFTFTKGVNASIAKVQKGYKVTFESSDLKLVMKGTRSFPKTSSVPKADIGSHVALGHTMLMTAFQPFPKELMKEFAFDQNDLTTLPAATAITSTKKTTSAVSAHAFAPTSPNKVVKSTYIKTEGTSKKPLPVLKANVSDPAVIPVKKPFGEVKINEGRVSLDFVNTDVVQILKSLARQTNSNIVTSPDVSGKLSIKIDNVSIKESLNLVTSLAGLRFTMVGKTYVVTSPTKFLETMRSVQGNQEEMTLSRIVPIFSGQGTQIKVAVLKSVSSENAFGRFELVLPSEKSVVSNTTKVTAPGAKKDEDKGGTDIATQTTEAATDAYVMLIGSPGRLDEVEQLVQGIDRQLCSALGVKVPTNNSQVLATYFVHGGRASDLVDAVAGKGKTMVGSVDLRSTPQGSISRQAIVVSGRDDEVANVMRALAQLDGEETSEISEVKMVDLLYVDPRALREFIVAQVPGVTCVIAPNGVMNSRAYVQDAMRTQSEQRGTDQPAPQGGGTAAASGQNQNCGSNALDHQGQQKPG